MNTRQIVDYAIDDNAKEMREALYNSIYDRVATAFDSKKQEYAQSLLGMPLATEEVEEFEEEKKEHEDEEEDEEMCKDAAKKEVKGHEKRMHKNEGY